MISSLKTLFKHPYNQQRPFNALFRFAHWKIIRMLKKKNLTYSLWNDRQIIISSDSFQSMWILYNYIVDWEEFNLTKKLILADDVVFDVGANIGVYTIWMSQFVNHTGRIHAFEPDDKNFQKLAHHLSINSISDRATINNFALAATSGELYFTTALDGENHISTEDKANTVKIEAETLDHYTQVNSIDFIKYLKIDVEGFELEVLKGGKSLLENQKILIIQLEINSTLANSNIKVEDLIGYLFQYNYQLCGYNTKENKVYPQPYSNSRENYFAIANLAMVNKLLQQT